MGRAIAALLAAAFIYPLTIIALGLHAALGGSLHVGILLSATVLILGFPALILCCKRQWWGASRIIIGGALGGALSAVPFAGSGSFHFVWLALAFALVGMAVAVPFWFAAIWRNDSLTCPTKFCLPCGQAYRYARNVLRRPVAERN